MLFMGYCLQVCDIAHGNQATNLWLAEEEKSYFLKTLEV